MALVVVAGCSGGAAQPGRDAGRDADAASEVGTPGGYSLDSFTGGFDFHLTLPPQFSPFLELMGDEVTRETPGFHDQTSTDYFSYELLWWLTGTPDLTTSPLRSDLSLYFTGLCASSTVVATLDEPVAGAGADAGAGMFLARRHGTLDAGQCFGAPVPAATLEVSTYHCPDHEAVIVLVSPQPEPGPTWTTLRAVRDSFRCW